MTPEEEAKISEATEQKIEGWFRSLSREEAYAWTDAYIEDKSAVLADAEQMLAGMKALQWLTRDCGPGTNPLALVESIRLKENKTLEEAEALDAWDRIKYKPLPPG
jgi:hypothetical protein